METDAGALYLYNVLDVRDALNMAESRVERFSTGRIRTIRKHVFLQEKLAGATLFKIPTKRGSMIFATEAVAAAFQSAAVTGIGFRVIGASL